MRILLVTDSHLAPGSGGAVANWRAVRAFAERAAPDLTMHLGDITRDGWSAPSELAFAASLAADWPTPIRFLPGNHDIGDNPPGPGVPFVEPLSLGLLANYRSTFGPDYWSLEEPGARAGWLMIGVNAQLFASGTAEEAAQWDWLDATLDGAGNRPVAVFSHKPLFQNRLEEEPPHIRYIPTEPRARLIAQLRRVDCRLFMSGHTHQLHDRTLGMTRHIWVPSTAYRFPDAMQEKIGEKIVGVGLLELGPMSRFDFLAPDGMGQFEFIRPAARDAGAAQ
jgi:3',5'-cyclic AMP phosphodiesterase CpdA